MDSSDSTPTAVADISLKLAKYKQLYQTYLDKSVPFTLQRWVGFGVLLVVFMLRIILSQGWYIVCYALGIYLLNLFLAFLQPKFDPSLEQDLRDQDMEEGEGLPISQGSKDDEFRPFIRRLPEFKFWHNATRATAIGFVCSWFSVFDVPVLWQILLLYFIILFSLTMRRQIQHMIKYRYLPFDLGKVKYNRS
ncbi:Rer1p [Sugiyamaella lignohabitans]|uniref:Protein RER1 n=1 Tax=Sugiyamaella lignohabitans TaxID=796027 RepID=A0A161HMJ0_9ASCO|nr:Rer1p [Sugiyamaella lignohabitans]ANB14977.1 Rer1p [Sugiyamaella lignohabitans]